MNKRGFTLIELITTFALATVIIIILLNIISIIKNIYVQNNIKSSLAIEQSNLSKLMNEKFNNKLKYYIACNDSEYCYMFSFENEENIKLIVEENKIRFGEYTYKLDKNTKVKNPTLTREYVDIDNTLNTDNFLVINIPVVNKLYPKLNFGINLVYFNKDYPYNDKINFKIGDTDYEAYSGMNWQDWVQSNFNISDYQIKSNYLYKDNSMIKFYSSDEDIYYNVNNYDIIVPSREYIINS